MEAVRNIKVDVSAFKVPRGFLRVLQFVISIFAFATVATHSHVTFRWTCGNNTGTTKFDYGYPFTISAVRVPCAGSAETFMNFNGDFAGASQFFCFVGVMSFLLCLALLGGYVIFSESFVKASRGANVDFILSCVWTGFWFIASCAWADGLSKLTAFLKSEIISLEYRNGCKSCTAEVTETADHSTLIVSVLFGFLNFCLWGAGLWFLFKETMWHKEEEEITNQPTPAAAGTDSPYQSPQY